MSQSSFAGRFGIATVSVGHPEFQSLTPKLKAAAKAGFKYIDLFDECWASYLREHGQNDEHLWEATPENLALARRLGQQIKDLGMEVICTQPLRTIEGRRDPEQRKAKLELAAKRFPFMRAFQTDLVFMCASMDKEPSSTSDYKTVVADLREIGRMAEEFSRADGGPMLRIGYEGLAWAQRNTWMSTWEVVRAVNRHNVGLVVDSFNLLAVEYADPYNPAGHGRIYPTEEESLDVLRLSLASFVSTVPGDRIFFVQIADAERMDPKTYKKPTDPTVPDLLPWSRRHRLYPLETEKGAYLPVATTLAAFLATGYDGPLSLEVFHDTLYSADTGVPDEHAKRGVESLERLCEAAMKVERYWGTPASETLAYKMWKDGNTSCSQLTTKP